MTKKRDIVEEAYTVFGYRFKDKSLLNEALTHASIAGHRLLSNERMEFLGDAILNYAVCEYLFRNHTDMLEGEMTKIKSAVVSRKVCAKISKQLKLSSMLSLGKGISTRAALPDSIAAAVLESVTAAIYLDGGIRQARRFVLKHMTPFIKEAAQSAHQQNFKSVLQQYAQKYLPNNPLYVYLDEKGPDHSKCFEVCVELDGRQFPSAWAASKKESEQKAALQALVGLELAAVEDDGQVFLREPLATEPPKKPASTTAKRKKRKSAS